LSALSALSAPMDLTTDTDDTDVSSSNSDSDSDSDSDSSIVERRSIHESFSRAVKATRDRNTLPIPTLGKREQRRLAKGGFVELRKLDALNIDEKADKLLGLTVTMDTKSGKAGRASFQELPKGLCTSFVQWSSCWWAYLQLMASLVSEERVQDLYNYWGEIHYIARSWGAPRWPSVAALDRAWRQSKQGTRARFSNIEQTTLSIYRNRSPEENKVSHSHSAYTAATTQTHGQGQFNRSPNMFRNQRGQSRQQNSSKVQICKLYNKGPGACRWSPCKHAHICMRCQKAGHAKYENKC